MMRTFLILLLAVPAMACGSTKNSEFQNSPELQGRPPTPDEDPFFYAALPPESARAGARGTIGDADDAPPEPLPDDVRALQARVRDAEARALDLKAENMELRDKLDRGRGSSSSSAAQCHSCVRICPEKGKCADDAEVICGWGTGKKKADAMLRATAECDGALEQYSRNGPWVRVDGKCPVAKCF